MHHDELVQFLVAGGVPEAELRNPTDSVTAYCSLLDPAGAEVIGGALAEAVRGLRPTKVLVWEDPDVNVLAHVAARELKTTAARGIEASGVLDLDGYIDARDRVVVIADAIRRAGHVTGMRALAEVNGAELVGWAVVLSTPAFRSSTATDTTIVLLETAETQAVP